MTHDYVSCFTTGHDVTSALVGGLWPPTLLNRPGPGASSPGTLPLGSLPGGLYSDLPVCPGSLVGGSGALFQP
jgi:hypothetical protein